MVCPLASTVEGGWNRQDGGCGLRIQTSLFHVGIDVRCIGKEVGLALQPCIQHLACFKHTQETPRGGRWPINLCLNYLLPLGIMEHSGASTAPPSKISQPHQILYVQELCRFLIILSLRFGWSKKEWDWKLLPPCWKPRIREIWGISPGGFHDHEQPYDSRWWDYFSAHRELLLVWEREQRKAQENNTRIPRGGLGYCLYLAAVIWEFCNGELALYVSIWGKQSLFLPFLRILRTF